METKIKSIDEVFVITNNHGFNSVVASELRYATELVGILSQVYYNINTEENLMELFETLCLDYSSHSYGKEVSHLIKNLELKYGTTSYDDIFISLSANGFAKLFKLIESKYYDRWLKIFESLIDTEYSAINPLILNSKITEDNNLNNKTTYNSNNHSSYSDNSSNSEQIDDTNSEYGFASVNGRNTDKTTNSTQGSTSGSGSSQKSRTGYDEFDREEDNIKEIKRSGSIGNIPLSDLVDKEIAMRIKNNMIDIIISDLDNYLCSYTWIK